MGRHDCSGAPCPSCWPSSPSSSDRKLLVTVAGYDDYFMPPPERVAARFVEAWSDGTMTPHVLTTLQEVTLGFAVGAGLALLAGYVLARSALAARVLSPYLVAAQATPILALAPLLRIWFGPGSPARS